VGDEVGWKRGAGDGDGRDDGIILLAFVTRGMDGCNIGLYDGSIMALYMDI
jgi:hypothetical protein